MRAGPMAAGAGFESVLMDTPTATQAAHARGWDARVPARAACDTLYRYRNKVTVRKCSRVY